MIKLGEVRKERERIAFRDWIAQGFARSGKFPVRVIFPPAKYPTFGIIFDDPENEMEVRMTIKSEKMREVFNALELPFKKSDLPALSVEVVVDENGLVYGLDLNASDPFYLAWRGTFWIRRRQEEEEDLGIEL